MLADIPLQNYVTPEQITLEFKVARLEILINKFEIKQVAQSNTIKEQATEISQLKDFIDDYYEAYP